MLDDFTALSILRESVGKILDYTVEGRRSLREIPMVLEAIVYNMEKMGIAAHQVSAHAKEASPEIPWRGLERINSMIVDEFTGQLDEDEIWSIIEHDLGDLYADLGVLGVGC